MKLGSLAVVAALMVALTSCGNNDEAALRHQVQAYSDAYLTGQGGEAYALLSSSCQARFTPRQFGMLTSAARQLYGTRMKVQGFEASIDGDHATVSYKFSVPALNQHEEPWVREGGKWREADC